MTTYTIFLKEGDDRYLEGQYLYQKEYPNDTPTREALMDFILDLQTNEIEVPKGSEIQIEDPDSY